MTMPQVGQPERTAQCKVRLSHPRRARAGSGAPKPPTVDLDAVFADLDRVVAFTGTRDDWREGASFLLRTSDARWQVLRFSDPAACGLVTRLLALPGFDAVTLFDLIATRDETTITLWAA